MSQPDQLFRTIVGDDWKRSLASARATPNSVASQIRDGVARTLAEKAKQNGTELAQDKVPQGDQPAYFKNDRLAKTRGQSPGAADRTQQFALVAARLRRAGIRVDVYSDYWLRWNLKSEYQRLAVQLKQALKACDTAHRPQVQQQIAQTTKNIAELNRVQGIVHNPKHIAVGMEYEQTGSLKDLVVLLHEAGHAVLRGNETLRPRVLEAVSAAVNEFQLERRRLNRRTAGATAECKDPEEILVQTIAQRTAISGIPNAPSFARGVVQWAKDLYFRCRMAFQAAGGEEIEPQLALKWFENQMARLVDGRFHGAEVSHGDANHQAAQLVGSIERLKERYAVANKLQRAQLLTTSDESVRAYGGPDLTGMPLRTAARFLVKGELGRTEFCAKAVKHFEAAVQAPRALVPRRIAGHER